MQYRGCLLLLCTNVSVAGDMSE